MKIPSLYPVGLILIFVGLGMKTSSFYLQTAELFEVGLGFSVTGITFLVFSFIKNRRKLRNEW